MASLGTLPPMTLSERTVGSLIVLVGDLSHDQLTTLLMRGGASQDDPGPSNATRARRAAIALNGARRRQDDSALLDCASVLLNGGLGRDPQDEQVVEFVRSLRGDGWLATSEVMGGAGVWDRPKYSWNIRPLGTAELPLPPQMSSAQEELVDHGLDVAANHLGQAYRAFAAGDLEASNAQLRPAFESTAITIAEKLTPWRGVAGGQAIEALNKADLFEKGEYEVVIGLWRMSHKNGSHPGVSSESEALFRVTTLTALLRFLAARFL